MYLGNYHFNFSYHQAENSIQKPTDAVGLEVTVKDDTEIIFSSTIYRFHKDPYNKETARKILLRDFMDYMNFGKERRTKLWNEYNSTKPGGRWSPIS